MTDEWMAFGEFAQRVLPGDSFKMKSLTTPGLDAREGFVLKCLSRRVMVHNSAIGGEEVAIPVLYPKGVPHYSGTVGVIHSSASTSCRFQILSLDE